MFQVLFVLSLGVYFGHNFAFMFVLVNVPGVCATERSYFLSFVRKENKKDFEVPESTFVTLGTFSLLC